MRGFCCLIFCLTAFSLSFVKASSLPWEFTILESDYPHQGIWGDAVYSQSLGEVNFGNGIEFPVILNFSSSRKKTTPFGGLGWTCQLLQSFAYPTSDSQIRADFFGGRSVYFEKSRKEKNVYYRADGKLKATLEDEKITVDWIDSKLQAVFYQGKIKTVTFPSGKTLEWIYSGKFPTEIRSTSSMPSEGIKVTYDDKMKLIKVLEFNGKTYRLTYEDRPLIENGVISGMESAMVQVACAENKQTYAFKYGMNPTGEGWMLLPTDKKLVWDTKTNFCLSDGDYNFEAKPFENSYPQVSRTEIATGKTQWTRYDYTNGIELQQKLDGTLKKKTIFTARGPLYKKTRKIEETRNGKTETIYEAFYNADAQIIKEVYGSENRTTFYNYLADGSKESASYYANGKVSRRVYDSKDRVIKIDSGDRITTTEYLNDDANTRIETRIEGENLLGRYFYVGNLLVRNERRDGITEVYNEAGKVKEVLTRVGRFLIFYDKDNEKYISFIKKVDSNNGKMLALEYFSEGKKAKVVKYFENGLVEMEDFKTQERTKNKTEINYLLNEFKKYEN